MAGVRASPASISVRFDMKSSATVSVTSISTTGNGIFSVSGTPGVASTSPSVANVSVASGVDGGSRGIWSILSSLEFALGVTTRTTAGWSSMNGIFAVCAWLDSVETSSIVNLANLKVAD